MLPSGTKKSIFAHTREDFKEATKQCRTSYTYFFSHAPVKPPYDIHVLMWKYVFLSDLWNPGQYMLRNVS